MESKYIQEKRITDAALHEFGLDPQDLNNEEIFNKQYVCRKYKELAKMWHPDRAKNKDQVETHTKRFREIHTYYGILLAMLDTQQGNGNDQKYKDNGIELIQKIALPGIFG